MLLIRKDMIVGVLSMSKTKHVVIQIAELRLRLCLEVILVIDLQQTLTSMNALVDMLTTWVSICNQIRMFHMM